MQMGQLQFIAKLALVELVLLLLYME